MADVSEQIQWTPLVFNSADWDLVQTQPFWHSFHYNWEVGRQIKQKMSKRGNVWEIGLWPDAETEKVARQCAEIFEEQFGLPNSSFVPDDSVMVLQTWGDGFVNKLRPMKPSILTGYLAPLANIVYHNRLFPNERYTLSDFKRGWHY